MASAMDDDTRESLARGRATLGSMLASARDDLRKAFLVFVAGFLGTFYALRVFIWDRLKADLNTNPNIEIIAVTPFDVILLQAKIGIAVGIILTVPVLIYYGRDALRVRGWWPAEDIPRWKFVFPGIFSALLFVGGVAYAYYVFFPVMLGFLARNAVNAGLQPSWSIVKWTEFIAFLSLSFGLAAQLPLLMSSLTYLRVVNYETFRDKWRHAVVAIFAFGAVASPPDPITQVMWALPLVALYFVSIQFARFAQLLRRSSEEVDFGALARHRWNHLAGVALVVGGGTYLFFTRGGVAAVNDRLAALPEKYRPEPLPGIGEATGLDPALAAALVGVGLAAVVAGAVLFVFAVRELDRARDLTEPQGSPADIDISNLDASAIGVTPPERWEAMDESEATELAREALEDEDDPEKAQAILDRYDEVQEQLEESDGDGDGAGASADGSAGGAAAGPGSGDDDSLASRTAGVVDAFTEDETTEEDVGGYYYDIAFILESITSRAFRIFLVFGLVMAGSFVYLYRGGIGQIRRVFVDRLPASMAEQVQIVALHPVEALVFAVKVSTLLGFVATLPVILYYAWPRLEERGLVGGDRWVVGVWGLSLVVGLVGGSLLGFFYVAPAVISWLARDTIQAHMVIHYQIKSFGWLVIFTTVGIGLLVEVPVTMLLFHRGGIVTFATMWERWRTGVFAIFLGAALFTPSSVLSMLVVAIPFSLAYLSGLALLWLVTLGGRRARRRESEPAD